jgi:uncharacterized membrane protein HdeD (DUF308 family)
VTPREWLAARAARQPGFEYLEIDADGDLPYERPADAIAAIGGVTEAQLYAASIARPVPAGRRRRITGLLGGVNAQLARRGALMLLGGVPLLLVPRIPPRLITIALAVWLLVEAIQTIVGAVGLRRSGKSWLPWALIGVVSLVFALFLAAREQFAFAVTSLVITAWVAGRAAMSLYAAWRARGTPGRRWALIAEGVLGILITVLIFIAPEAAGPLLRYTIGGYLTASGIIALLLAWRVHRQTRTRMERYLEAGTEAG